MLIVGDKVSLDLELKLGNVKEDNDITFTLLGEKAKPVLNEVRVDVWALPAAPRAAGANSPAG